MQIITWLTGAHPILVGEIKQPSEFPDAMLFDVSWDWSHSVNGDEAGRPFLPLDSCNAIIQVARDMDAEEFIEDILTDPAMELVTAELAGMPEQFLQLYCDVP